MNPPTLPLRRRALLARVACQLACPTGFALRRTLHHLLVASVLTAPAVLSAQQAATGTVVGRVANSATGTAISNAQVAIVGTNRFVVTDESGQYYLPGIPAGSVTLHVSAASLDAQDISVTVAGNQMVTQNVGLTSKALYGDTVKLDQFVVSSTRETNSAAIAINEQRTNPNITSVVSAQEFGPQVDQNPGELLKMLPGVDVTYFANNITGVSVNGLPSDYTEIQFDGMRTASFNSEGISRGMEVQYQSAADVSRVSIRKLPLPEDSANTIGGTINFIRRSAFEYEKMKVDYSLEFRSDGEHLTLADMQGVKDRTTSRWKPNWTIGVTDPVTKNFGFSLTLGQNDVDVNTHWSLPGWNWGTNQQNLDAAAAIAAGKPVANVPSIYNPAMRNPLSHDAPKEQGKDFISLNLDWRPVESLTLNWTLSGTKGWVQNADDVRFTWDNHATGSGDVTRFNDRSNSLGQAGDGAIYFNAPLWRDVYSPTEMTNFEARWHHNAWSADVKAALSESRYQYKDTEDGFFSNPDAGNVTGLVNIPMTGVGFNTGNPIPLTVDYHGLNYWGMRSVAATTVPTGQSTTNIANYTVPVNWQDNASMGLGGVRSRPARGKELLAQVKSYIKRDFYFENPLSLQFGFDWSQDFRERRYPYYTWRFVGPNNSVSQISAVKLKSQSDWEYGYPGPQRISMSRYYALYQTHPEWFQYDAARSDYLSKTNNSAYKLWEKIPAGYGEFDWHLFHNRLNIAGGVRYERVIDDATGLFTNTSAAYMKYANGQTVRSGDLDANGKAMVVNLGSSSAVNYQLVNAASVLPKTAAGSPIYLPAIQQAGNAQVAAGQSTDTGTNIGRASIPYIDTVYRENGARGHGVGDGYYPDLNLSYNIAENLVFQAGYARTIGRLDMSNVLIPGTTTNDSLVTSGVGAGAIGTITVHNTDLKPWTANNFDARLTWYNQSGGYIGLGAFTKRVQNIIATTSTAPLQQSDIDTLNAQYPDLNLQPSMVGYSLTTQQNAGSGREDGVELEFRQLLDPWIGRWVPGIRLYATSTYQHATGPNGNIFTNIHWHDKLGVAYAHGRFSANVNWTHIGLQVDQAITTSSLTGVTGYQYELPQDLLDFSIGYQITRNVRATIGATDLLDALRAREQRYPGLGGFGSMTSSNTYGKSYYVGVTGQF